MSRAYTPTLQVSERTQVEKTRELPIPGKALVQVGDRVSSNSPVLSAELPGDVEIIRIAQRIGLDPLDVIPGMKVSVNDPVEKGQLLCEVKTFFGLMTLKVHCPLTGTIEFFTQSNAHMGIRRPHIPLEINAYIDGVVSSVEEGKSVTIQNSATFIQGIFGVGGETSGHIVSLPVADNAVVETKDLSILEQDLSNAVLIGGSRFSPDALNMAADIGVAAVLTGSVDSETLHHFLGYDIGLSITGDEDVPFTFIVSEGFGELALSGRISSLAQKLNGKMASVNGTTQVRAGAMRPEIIVSATSDETGTEEPSTSYLDIGSQIRLIRVPYFGQRAIVTELPHDPAQIPTGAWVRVLKARLENGEEILVPRANVELV